jgi:hypothetical protein
MTVPRKIVPLLVEPPAARAGAYGGAGQAAAAPAAVPHISYHGGAVIGSVEVVLIFWGAHWVQSGLAGGATLQGQLNDFFDHILTSAFMDMLAEYSTATTQIAHGKRLATVNVSANEPGAIIGGVRTVSDAQIQQALQEWTVNRTVPAATANTLYFVYLPPDVVCSFQNSQSCTAFCGYHENAGSIFYAVEPYITCAGCSFGAILDSQTKVSSHELAEAVTDPAGAGWWDPNSGDEIGDICNASTTRLGGYLVQNQWSNSRSACVL